MSGNLCDVTVSSAMEKDSGPWTFAISTGDSLLDVKTKKDVAYNVVVEGNIINKSAPNVAIKKHQFKIILRQP